MRANRIWMRLALALVSLAPLNMIVGCAEGSSFPDRIDAGVLMTGDGTMYLVLTPCAKMTVDEIALKYAPPGASAQSPEADLFAVRYQADSPMSPSQVFPPLLPSNGAPEGWSVKEFDDELISAALKSTRSSTFDNRFYVEVLGYLGDGSRERLGGSWSADLSQPDTVVLGGQVLDDPLGRVCQNDHGWTISG